MLVRLFGKNFRSLRDDFELSMIAADLTRKEDRDRGIIEVPIKGMTEPLQLLRCVGIYGPNASGKSTVMRASRALLWLATNSSNRSKPEAKIPPYEPFILDDEMRTAPIELGCEVVYKTKILRYEIKFEERTILTETLTRFDEDREVKLIDRQQNKEVRGELIPRTGANRLYVKEMQPNVAVLSKLAQHGPRKGKESVLPFYTAIRNSLRHEDYTHAGSMEIRIDFTEDDPFGNDVEYRAWIMKHLIQAADVGICDVETRSESFEVPDFIREDMAKINSEVKLPDQRLVVSFVHEGTSNRAIDFSQESTGTKKLFNIAGDWWRLANESGTLFADELSASLHPRLLDRLIRAVNDAPSGVQSQLIFTTHDTGLLEGLDGLPPALRRDQVYFTKKNATGASEIYSLAEFKDDARPVHNIRKRYLSGLYGAIPLVEKLSL